MSENKKRKPRKSIKDKKDLEVSFDGQNVDVDIDRKDGKFTADIDTKNLDVQIERTDEGVKVDVQSTNKFWGWVGNILKKVLLRKRK